VQGEPCQRRISREDSENARERKVLHWELWSAVHLLRGLRTGEIRGSKRFWDKDISALCLGTEGAAQSWGKQRKVSSRTHQNRTTDGESTAANDLAWWQSSECREGAWDGEQRDKLLQWRILKKAKKRPWRSEAVLGIVWSWPRYRRVKRRVREGIKELAWETWKQNEGTELKIWRGVFKGS